MLFKRFLITLLDRPSGRSVLAKLATLFARWRTNKDIEIKYDEMWVHRINQYYFPHGTRFEYDYGLLCGLIQYERRCRDNVADYWFEFYNPKEGDLIVDVGAGRGEDVFVFSQEVGNTGRVIAIEAHPLSFRHLEMLCKLNKLSNVTTLNIATMDKPGSIQMAEAADWESNSIGGDDETAGITVYGDSIDNVADKIGIREIAFLKMNIEGAERQALVGMKRTIGLCRRICVACHDFRADLGHGEQFRTRAFVEEFLKQHGFKVLFRESETRDYVRDQVFGVRGDTCIAGVPTSA